MTGKYTVVEVEERTNVPATTLRQWERRYAFPMPERSSSGYRLYSQEDVEKISMMKRHIDDGVPASRAAELVKRHVVTTETSRPANAFSKELAQALVSLDESRADALMSEAHALHSVEAVLFDIVKPTMIEIGQRWHDGDISVAVEHFATNYVHGRLRSLLNLSPNSRRANSVVVACAPNDQHELGALMLSVLLRRMGYKVYYLGSSTPIPDLHEMVTVLKPSVVMISASLPESLNALEKSKALLFEIPCHIVYGGRAFEGKGDLAKTLGGHYLGNEPLKVVENLDSLSKRARL